MSISNKPNAQPQFALSVEGIRKIIEGGTDPQQLLADVVSLVIDSLQAKATALEQRTAADCIVLLAHSGARVATGESSGCALQTLIRAPVKPIPGAINRIVSGLVPIPGELPFHTLAREFPATRWGGVLSTPSDVALKKLRSRDPNGRTVSHWLWDPESILTRKDDLLDYSPQIQCQEAVRMTWTMQSLLQKQGASMDLPDAQGKTAMDLCLERLDNGDVTLFDDLDICRQVRAHGMSRSMSEHTPPAATPAPTPRF